MYYLYYGIWLAIKPRLSRGTILGIELGFLSLVVLLGLAMMITGFHMLGGLNV